MKPVFPALICGCLLLLVLPVAASPVLTTVSFTPNPPLVAGGPQEVVASFAIPSGTTFPREHELQLQTGLENPAWVIQVVVDGHDSARQTASGSAAFINGMLLSYSANRDVRFTVTVTGTVPRGATSAVTVLDMVEIGNTNAVVPKSQVVITQPVAGVLVVPEVSSLPTRTHQVVPTATPVAQSPGFAFAFAILGGSIAGIFRLRRW
ncbi:hypothetical protein [Methanoregula sp.]|uniref:hypothetical protein n=1 Tax=Methanoregula sp. TaxID=2052170 RepID=UPI002628C88E|nr:hypothetical protein [Methanoregula sp.]MDD5143907.1 hypothetical protein [Methanoregula sp.]